MAVAPTSRNALPLTKRPLDLLYFCFFAIHIPASILVDFQAFYKDWPFVPSLIKQIPEFYISLSNDPLIGGAMGYPAFGSTAHLVWFKTFLALELLFQLPVFVLGMIGLWKGSRAIYVLLLAYAASTATTTIPCIAVVLASPITSKDTLAQGLLSITSTQQLLLLSSYIPFFLVPFGMAVDMSFRVLNLVNEGVAVEESGKRK